MRFKVVVEQKRTGFVECDVPDEKWEQHTDRLYRRKLVKQAANRAIREGAEIEWLLVEPDPPEATTGYAEMK